MNIHNRTGKRWTVPAALRVTSGGPYGVVSDANRDSQPRGTLLCKHALLRLAPVQTARSVQGDPASATITNRKCLADGQDWNSVLSFSMLRGVVCNVPLAVELSDPGHLRLLAWTCGAEGDMRSPCRGVKSR